MLIEQSQAPGLGHLYAPAGEGRHPALLLLHGSEGALGWLGHRDAAIFAAHGYLALPFAYAVGGNPWIGGDIWNVAARRHRAGDGGPPGASALQRRGLASTAGRAAPSMRCWRPALMAEAGSPHLPDAVAAHAPPDLVHGAWRNLFYRHRETGDPIAPPPAWGFMEERVVAGLPAWTWRGAPVPAGAAIPIEAFAGPVFLSVGEADELWPPDMAPRLAERLRAAGRDVELHSYPGQLHMPDPAGWNTHIENLLAFFGRALAG